MALTGNDKQFNQRGSYWAFMSAGFTKVSSREKLLLINEELLKMAKDAGAVLPR